ncbi:MAG: ComF family protein [Bacteroidales bacterium]
MLTGIHKDFINLFFPPLCAACNAVLVKQEQHICTGCLYNLPKTNFHLDRDNPMAQLFWGRVRVEAAASLYYFEKGSKCRKILHQIKYRGKKELAFFLGKIYGFELSRKGKFTGADVIVPVPLHSSRERSRGFNQSDWFARGISCSMGKKVDRDILIRFICTETQTNKSRAGRWENVENSFVIKDTQKAINKHILLVDDVVTTGATLESCAQVLIRVPGVSISILTIAYA